jgi:hypothetical protein
MSITQSVKNRRMRSLLGVALICILLGAGNILFGQLKANQYSTLLSEARAELARPESTLSLPLLGPTMNIDKQTQHITRLEIRVDFYNFVVLGGQCLVALGFISLAACLLMVARGEEVRPSPPN